MVAQYYNPSTVTTEARLGVWEQPRLHSDRVSLQGGAYNRLDLLFFFFLGPCFISFSKFENISCMRICQNLYFQTSLEIPNLDIIYKELGIAVFQNSSLIPALRIFHNQLVVHMSLSPTFKKKKNKETFLNSRDWDIAQLVACFDWHAQSHGFHPSTRQSVIENSFYSSTWEVGTGEWRLDYINWRPARVTWSELQKNTSIGCP